MNRYRTFLVVVLMILVEAVTGQEYFTQGATPDLFLTHKVAPRETWYSIGRVFNLAPGDVATYNKLSVDKPLDIGQEVKIPLTAGNFTQDEDKTAGNVLIPVYHVVQEKEWMYRISVNHNKVPIEKIEKWNNITRDEAKAGTKLIVGYLKTGQANSPLAENNTPKQQVPATSPNNTQQTAKPAGTAAPTTTSATPGAGAGYFRTQYAGQNNTRSGVAGIFKSTSGWKDGKYYALMNNVTVGTIVKITYPQTSKSIYAKVLGELPEMKESDGLSLRISDAAAKELGAVAAKFSVDIIL